MTTRDASTMTINTLTDDYYNFNGKANGNIFFDQNISVIAHKIGRPATGYLLPFRVTWKGLTYKVGKTQRTILNNVSGSFRSGQITALMGPSGAGKSSLLGCICGLKRTGVSGAITISTKRKVKFAFIAQDNYLMERLSIMESLVYASKLKNKVMADHQMIARSVLKKLMIEKCGHIRPSRCSGGQQKRISIALELVSRPNILILDEPTSGLDSVTTWQLVQLLIELTQQPEPMAIAITIHQPSAKLFNLFNTIYLLSCEGQCIYNGSPQKMLDVFADHDLDCPPFNNPSDFALEVAANEHGLAKIMMLSTVNKIDALDMDEDDYQIRIRANRHTWRPIFLLTIRSFETTMRDPYMLGIKLSGYMMCSALISLMYGSDSGILSSCASDFSIGDGKDLFKKFADIMADLIENCSGILFVCIFGWLMSIFPVLLVFPSEMNVFLKEYGNGYYTPFAYYMSKVLSDIPFQLVLPNLGSIPVYYWTGQYSEQAWRIYGFAGIFILISMNASAQGFLISAIVPENPLAAALIGLLSIIPMALLSGLMIPLERMPFYFRSFSYVNFLRYSSEVTLINIYGFGRCGQGLADMNDTTAALMDAIPTEKMLEIYSSDKINVDALMKTMDNVMDGFTGEDHSVILKHFKLDDYDYYTGIAMLIVITLGFRALTYYFILRKIKSKT